VGVASIQLRMRSALSKIGIPRATHIPCSRIQVCYMSEARRSQPLARFQLLFEAAPSVYTNKHSAAADSFLFRRPWLGFFADSRHRISQEEITGSFWRRIAIHPNRSARVSGRTCFRRRILFRTGEIIRKVAGGIDCKNDDIPSFVRKWVDYSAGDRTLILTVRFGRELRAEGATSLSGFRNEAAV
jgi:hypothetical protein